MAAVVVAAPMQPPQPAPVAAADAEAEPKDTSAPATPAQGAGKGKGLRAFRERLPLRRAFSTKHASLSTPALLSPLSQPDERPPPTAKSPRTKLTAFERYVNAKLAARKVGKKPKGTVEDVSVQEIPVAVELDSVPSSSSSSASADAEEVLPAILESATAAEPETAAPAEQASTNDATDPNPEPLPLARKIQSLLSALPPFLSPLSPPTPPATPAPGSDGEASNGEKKPTDDTDPGAPSTIDNSRLISLLSSPTMMNGSLSRGRQSVWALLDNLRIKSLMSSGNASSAEGSDGSVDGLDVTMEDDDSVMFYAPLIPNAASTVELARSEIVSVDENGTIVDVILDDAPLPGVVPPKTGFGKIWPFSSGTSTPTPTTPKPKVLTEKRVWVPSTTQLSLQVMWWGYRLYVL